MTSISEASEKIKTLVEKYRRILAEGKDKEYNEEKVKLQFINPFLEALGWDVEGKRNPDEVVPEQRTLVGPVDFSLKVNGKEKIFFEVKKFSEDLSGFRTIRGKRQSYAEQAINYAWHRKVDWAVLTNFKELRLYYTHVKRPEEGLIFKVTFDEYLEKLSKIWLLSKEAVSTGLLDREEKRRTRKDIDVEVLEDLFEARKLLTKDVYEKYRGIDTELIKEGIQRILDRLIVIRFMEDKGIEPAEALLTLLETYNSTVSNKEAVPFMSYLKNKFVEFNETYNSKIFEPHECDKFAISNRTFEIIIKKLYKYNFDLIDADVLGNIYEDYLGHVLEEKGRSVEIVEKQTKRKEYGIYYTPTYVVDYIVRNTVGALIEEKKRAILNKKFGGKVEKELNSEEKKEFSKLLLSEIDKIKVLDPACGSGSFLIKAFDVIKEYYDQYYESKSSPMPPEKRILVHNLYGVDLDRQATEIASVNLMLKALKKGQKLPLILDENIKCGNSLISGTEEELKKYFGDAWKDKKPFNWKEEFPDVFENGGFDVVIGNPPYVQLSMRGIDPKYKEYLIKTYGSSMGRLNTFGFFIKLGILLLKEGGKLGFIIPNTLLTQDYYEKLREMILDSCKIKSIVDFSKLPFKEAVVENIIIILEKAKSERTRNSNAVNIFSVDEHHNFVKKRTIQQEFFQKTYKKSFNIFLDDHLIALRSKIEKNTKPLKEYLEVNQAIALKHDREKYLSKIKHDDSYKPVIDGRHINRYSLQWDGSYLRYDINAIHSCKREDIFLQREKLFFRRVSNKLIATLDKRQFYALNTLVVMNKKEGIDLDIRYFLALFNSNLLNFYYKNFLKSTKKVFSEIQAKQVEQLPIKVIDLRNPTEKAIHDKLVSLADKMLTLKKQYHKTLDIFKKILENMSDSKTNYRPLKDYYPSSDYGISPVESKKLIDIRLTGKVIKLEVFEKGNNILIKGEYIPGEKGKGTPISNDILKIHFIDPTLKKFFYYSIKTFLLENSKKKVWGSGKIVDVVLKAIKIPRFYNLKIKDVEKIKELMEEFFKTSPIGDKSLTELEMEIVATDRTIDEKVYELYDLTDEEIDMVENNF